MPKDYFETVTALDDLHSKAVKEAAGVDKAPKEDSHQTALDEIDNEMKGLRKQGRDLMSKGAQHSPEYDALVKKNRELRRRRLFVEDSSKDKD